MKYFPKSVLRRGHKWRGRLRWLEPISDSLQIQALARETEYRGGILQSPVGESERALNHRALEVLNGGWHRLIDANDNLRRIERALRGRDSAS
jgi:hypothetical protein